MNNAEFQQRIAQSGKPVIVDFWAPWCAPCRMTKPILEKLAREYADQVAFVPIDADAAPEVVDQLKVMGIPTLLAFRDGKEVGRVSGAQSEAYYRSMFAALAAGEAVKVSMAPFDRLIRLGAGVLLVAVGVSTSTWLLVVLGGLMAFLGVYDRCPVWRAITASLKRNAG